MNTARFTTYPVALAALLSVALIASDAFATTARCAAPASRVDRVACEKAREGPDALRRYVARTQSIYGLYFWDYMSATDLESHYARQARSSPGDDRHEAASRR